MRSLFLSACKDTTFSGIDNAFAKNCAIDVTKALGPGPLGLSKNRPAVTLM